MVAAMRAWGVQQAHGRTGGFFTDRGGNPRLGLRFAIVTAALQEL
jgi:hypothetical protein